MDEIKSRIEEVTDNLQMTTVGLQFHIEAVKETDPIAFIEVSDTKAFKKSPTTAWCTPKI